MTCRHNWNIKEIKQREIKNQRHKGEPTKKTKKKVYTVYIYTAYMLYNVIIIKNNIEEKRKDTYEKLNREKQIECTSKIRKSNTI